MASMKYQVEHEAPGLLGPRIDMPSTNTVRQHKAHLLNCFKWARVNHGCKKLVDLPLYVQAYEEALEAKGLTAATIHTYIAGVCFCLDIPMAIIKKPIRHCADITRSRGVKAVDSRADAKAPEEIAEFQKRVGIRRRELLRLRKNNLRRDESGYLCVEIIKGKGGKYQLQRVLPEDEEFVSSYFDGTDDFLFPKEMLRNKADFHRMRSLHAQRMYQYYMHRLETEPGYREQLIEEMRRRWEKYRGTPPKRSKKKHDWAWDDRRAQGTYHLRGLNREMALREGLPTSYDRAAVLATSIFALSHWRTSVCVNNYLLAK